MKIEFRASSPADAAQLAGLCRRVLAVPEGSPMFDAAVLHWKYWQPWSSWNGSRGYVLTRGERLIAHCGVMPLVVRRGERAFTLLYPFDWAAEPQAVGSGAALLERLTALADGVVFVGGSQMAQRLADPLGFRPAPPVKRFALPLSAARGGSAALARLELRRVQALSSAVLGEPAAARGYLDVQHPASVLNEWLRCPAARVQCHEVFRSGSRQGALLVAFTPGQARLLELWPASSDPAARLTLLEAARVLSERDADSAELVAMANTPLDEQALLGAGFRPCGELPMSAALRTGELSGGGHPRYQLLQGDMGFLHHGVPERWGEGPGAQPGALPSRTEPAES